VVAALGVLMTYGKARIAVRLLFRYLDSKFCSGCD
jgi:hypothetical protein